MLERTGVLFQINSEETNWNQLFKLNKKSTTGILEHTCAMLDFILSAWTFTIIILIAEKTFKYEDLKNIYLYLLIYLF